MSTAYDRIAAVILDGMTDAASWQPPWHRDGLTIPTNGVTGRRYEGVNILSCWASAYHHGYSVQRWATYQQWQSVGAQVRKGEKATPIVFWKQLGDENTPADQRRWVARGFSVFNHDQVDGAPEIERAPDLPESERMLEVEAFVDRLRRHCLIVEKEQDQAYYNRAEDKIVMPPFGRFKDAPYFYATLLHEVSHWTGAEGREGRTFGKRFGDDAYALEELVAELSAVFLACDLGIEAEPRPDHAAYIGHWFKILKEKPEAFATAVAHARKAAAFVHATANREEMNDAA